MGDSEGGARSRRPVDRKSKHARKTNRSEESKRFSTVRPAMTNSKNDLDSVMAKTSIFKKPPQQTAAPMPNNTTTTSQDSAPKHAASFSGSGGATGGSAGGAAPAVFDPIPNDGMFDIPSASRYWPPSAEFIAKVGQLMEDSIGGQYDRRGDGESGAIKTNFAAVAAQKREMSAVESDDEEEMMKKKKLKIAKAAKGELGGARSLKVAALDRRKTFDDE